MKKTSFRLLAALLVMLFTLACGMLDDDDPSIDEETDGDETNDDNDDCLPGWIYDAAAAKCVFNGGGGDDADGDEEAVEDEPNPNEFGCDENDPDELRAQACIMLRYLNQDRAMFPDESNNAQPLMWDEEMYPVALAHSQDMCDNNYFDHYNLEGKSPFDRMNDGGVAYKAAGENIAMNPFIMDSQYRFMAECVCTENHRSNCLEPTFTSVGIGIVECDHAPNGMAGEYYYITQNFRAVGLDPIIDVPYCDDPSVQNTYWEEPASSAPVSDYFGLQQRDENHYTTCEGEKRMEAEQQFVGKGMYFLVK